MCNYDALIAIVKDAIIAGRIEGFPEAGAPASRLVDRLTELVSRRVKV
jgi:hypothetical protein